MKHIKLFEQFSKINEEQKCSEELYDAMMNAWEKFDAQFDDWAFDERDSAEFFETYVEDELKRKLTAKEKQTDEFKEALEQADELINAAESVGYEQRKGDRVSVAKAEEKYWSLKGSSLAI